MTSGTPEHLLISGPTLPNPRKLITRGTRRLLYHLTHGGRLVRIQAVVQHVPGPKRRKDFKNPERFYFMLHPQCGSLPGRPSRTRMVRKPTVEHAIAVGYLKPYAEWRDRGEAGEAEVTAAGREILDRSDWDGWPIETSKRPVALAAYLKRLVEKRKRGRP